MYVISECVMCAVILSTLSAFAFAFCVVILTIKQGRASRRRPSRAFQKVGALPLARPAAVVALHNTSGR
jgi:ABC-type Fe3+ transport system permease subunit